MFGCKVATVVCWWFFLTCEKGSMTFSIRDVFSDGNIANQWPDAHGHEVWIQTICSKGGIFKAFGEYWGVLRHVGWSLRDVLMLRSEWMQGIEGAWTMQRRWQILNFLSGKCASFFPGQLSIGMKCSLETRTSFPFWSIGWLHLWQAFPSAVFCSQLVKVFWNQTWRFTSCSENNTLHPSAVLLLLISLNPQMYYSLMKKLCWI